jgi:phthalate 4,5-dioxygenase
MLSKADTEYLCRIGPGTPMGNLFRQYLLPAIKSDERQLGAIPASPVSSSE